MKLALISLLAGLCAGAVYGLVDLDAPAPPLMAIIGLVGMLAGQEAVLAGKALIQRHEHPQAVVRKAVAEVVGTPTAEP